MKDKIDNLKKKGIISDEGVIDHINYVNMLKNCLENHI